MKYGCVVHSFRPGEVLVLLLCGIFRLGDHLLRRHDGCGEDECQSETKEVAP